MYKATAILNLLSATAKVMFGWGIYFPQPIAINVGANLKRFLNEISAYDSKPFSSEDKVDVILEAMTVSSVDPVVFYYDGSFKGNTRVWKLLNTIKTGQYLGNDIKRLGVIVTEQPLNEDLLNRVFYMDFNPTDFMKFDLWKMLPRGEELSLVHDKIADLSPELSEEGAFLKGCGCFMYPYFRKKDKLPEYDGLLKYLDEIIELNCQAKDNFGLSAQFVKALYEYRRDGKKLPLIKLPNINTVVTDSEADCMFHDLNYVYISNVLFGEITKEFKHVIGPNRLKEVLVEDGLLVKGSGKGFTSKMPFYDQYGRFRRTDALRFDLEKLQRPGKVDLITEFGG